MRVLSQLALFFLLALASAYSDSVTYNVTLDTTPLLSSTAGPFSLAFELADGSGTGDGDNAALLSNFDFGSGSPSGSPLLAGGATGDLSTSVVLTNTSAFENIFVEGFAPGDSLSFQLQLSTNLDSPNPDTFLFAILDSTLTPIPTTAGAPIDALALINIDGPSPTVQTFSGDTSRSPAGGGNPIDIDAPIFSVAEVPEPATLPTAGVGLVAAVVFSMLRRRVA